MATTVIGFFDTYQTAEKVVRELTAGGFRREDIQIQSGDASGGTQSGFGARVSNFFSSLFGDDLSEAERGNYAEAVRRGNAVVAVRAEDNEAADRITELMERNGAIDIDERIASYRERGYTGFDANAQPYTTDEAERERNAYRSAQGGRGGETLPVVEEELRVGKRAVERGGVRIVRRLREQPVEETVNLREERVSVERRPVDRPVEEADLAAFREGTIEVTEMGEEVVVDKRARVVEEVVVNKEVTEHAETVRDTVRRSDVEVEKVDAERSARARRRGK
jgi:uncharacterized protein (TIGR02271 family)